VVGASARVVAFGRSRCGGGVSVWPPGACRRRGGRRHGHGPWPHPPAATARARTHLPVPASASCRRS